MSAAHSRGTGGIPTTGESFGDIAFVMVLIAVTDVVRSGHNERALGGFCLSFVTATCLI